MKSLTKITISGLMVLACSAFAAQAADLPPPIVEHTPPPVVDVGHWYLRGDIGVGVLRERGFRNSLVTNSGGQFLNDKLEDQAFIGAGIGYAFNRWFRVDGTVEYRQSNGFSGEDEYTFTCTFVGGACGAIGQNIRRNNFWDGDYRSLAFMANAYVDLWDWWKLRPFIGAGIGVAWNQTRGVREWDVSGLGGGSFSKGASKANFAWSLMAGLGYEINNRLALEAGYRFMSLGSAETGTLTAVPTNQGLGTVPSTEIRNIYSHDIRLSMRWLLHKHAPPPPIITKF